MRAGRYGVLVCLVAAGVMMPRGAVAQAKCPWLNAATAAGLLGGAVEMTVSAPVGPAPVESEPAAERGVAGQAMYPDQVRMDRFDVACTFTRKVDAAVYSLRIAVTTMSHPAQEFSGYLGHCAGKTVALRAIGNEAVQCVGKNSAAGEEQVMARVRERAFTLTVRRAPGEVPEGLRPDTRNIAEQVAGSLF